jgi:RNase P/RNase MRP subunit p29
MINRDNALVHEWIGLKARVKKSSCRAMEGICGTIVDETRNTLVLEDAAGTERKIPKKSCTFEIELQDGIRFVVLGSSVGYAPEERLKKLFRKSR